MENFIVQTLVPITVWFVAGAFVFLGIFIFISLFNPRDKFRGLIGLVALLALIAVCYFVFASDAIEGIFNTGRYADRVSPALLKYTEGGILTSLVMIVIGAVSWVGLEVVNLFK